jgi:hypothetical protein
MEEYRKKFKNDFLNNNDELYIRVDNGEEIDIRDNKLDNKPGLDICFDDSNLDDKLPRVPEHIKYIKLSCEPIHYVDIPKLLSSSSLEFVKITMPLSGIFNHNMLDYIKLSKSIKALALHLCNDNTDEDTNEDTNEDANANADANDDADRDINKKIQDAVDLMINKSIIPRDIEYLLINFNLSNINEYTNLKTLVISASENTEYNYSLDNLPESLEWLEIHPMGFNQPVNNLPANLKVLIFSQNRIWNYYNGYQHSIDNLPPSLEVLYLPEFLIWNENKVDETYSQSCQSNQSILENLPPNLRILNISEFMPDNINYNSLPDSIEIIHWRNFPDCYKEITRFPTNLKKIQIIYDNDEIEQYFNNAPFTIEVLRTRRK